MTSESCPVTHEDVATTLNISLVQLTASLHQCRSETKVNEWELFNNHTKIILEHKRLSGHELSVLLRQKTFLNGKCIKRAKHMLVIWQNN
jgi:hypothetical protein